MPALRAGIHALLDHHGASPKSWMLAFGKHDGDEVERANPTVMPALCAGIHALLDHHGASSKPWMLAFGKHDG
jgi:hypothetical protein